MTTRTDGWKRGLPPGPYYDGMTDDFEVCFAPLAKWHRRRSPVEKEAWIKLREANRKAVAEREPFAVGETLGETK